MSAATLYQIRDDLAALDALLAEVGGDVSDEAAEAAVDAWLAETTEALASKLDAYAALIRERETRAAARETEAERLKALAASDAHSAKRLKDRLAWFLRERGVERVETPRFRVSLARNGGKTPVALSVPPEDLPEELCFVRVSYVADTETIRARLEAGALLPYATLGERGYHVRIK